MASERQKKKALKQLEADLYADDISPDEFNRERTRIEAGSSKSVYLKRATAGLHVRAFDGDQEAMVKLGIRYVVLILVILAATGIVGAVIDGYSGEGFEVDD